MGKLTMGVPWGKKEGRWFKRFEHKDGRGVVVVLGTAYSDNLGATVETNQPDGSKKLVPVTDLADLFDNLSPPDVIEICCQRNLYRATSRSDSEEAR